MLTRHACCFLAPPGDDRRLIVELTLACSVGCRHCQVDAGSLSGEEMSTKVIRNLLSRLRTEKFSRVTFTGGEPLLRDDVLDLIVFARSQGYYVELLSSLTTDHDITAIIPLVDEITTSIDGPTADIHDWLRCQGAFQRTITNCTKIADSNLDNWKVLSTVHARHAPVVTETVELLAEMRPRKIMFMNPKAEGRAEGRGEILLTDDVARAVAEELASAAQEVPFGIGLSRFPWITGQPLEQCIAGDRLLYVEAGGTILPCQHWRQIEPLTVQDVLGSDRSVMEHMEVIRRVAATPGTEKCPLAAGCGGGCRPFELPLGADLPVCDQLCPAARNEVVAGGESCLVDF